MDAITKMQHKHMGIKLKAALTPSVRPLRRINNLRKSDLETNIASDIDVGISDITHTPCKFDNLLQKALKRHSTRVTYEFYMCPIR